jgi:hypothetical protein
VDERIALAVLVQTEAYSQKEPTAKIKREIIAIPILLT